MLLFMSAACGRPATEDERAAILAGIDSVVAEIDSMGPVYRGEIRIAGATRSVTFDINCSDELAPTASFVMFAARQGESFASSEHTPATTRVLTRVDALPQRDEQWVVDGVSGISASSPAPVSLGQQLIGAKQLTVTFWPYGGDSTTVLIDLAKAQGRLRGAAAACRWPA